MIKFPFEINATTRLVLAVHADEEVAYKMLEANGFKGLKRRKDMDNLISFYYTSYSPEHLAKYLGNPKKNATGNLIYHFGKAGSVIIIPDKKIVRLTNTGGAGAQLPDIKPIETHVPEHVEAPHIEVHEAPTKAPAPEKTKPAPPVDPKTLPPQENPNEPGAKDNDDTHVPNVKIPQQLSNLFWFIRNAGGANASPGSMLKFNKGLWEYFNGAKFGGKLQEPHFALLKNQASTKMRLRGRWWPSKKQLDIAPRLFNASERFFIEIFLHEMCHQAVTQIDNKDHDQHERANKGHGHYWAAWMRKVGLNPLRFDPNDNSEYMNEQEKQVYQQNKEKQIQKQEQVKKDIADQQLRRMLSPASGKLATINWNNQIYHGMLACPNDKAYKRWAFVNLQDPMGSRYMIVPSNNIYNFAGPQQEADEKSSYMINKCERIRSYIEQKSANKSAKMQMNKQLKSLFGY